MKVSHNTARGFTIVELLVVVIIIAILATIGIVAYGNITKRAQNAVYHADARTILTKLDMFYSTYNRYPLSADTEMVDPSSPMALPSDVQVLYTDVGVGSMRNSVDTTAPVPEGSFTIGTYQRVMYFNPTTGVKTYVAKPCMDLVTGATLGLRIYYPDVVENVNGVGASRTKHIGVGSFATCLTSGG